MTKINSLLEALWIGLFVFMSFHAQAAESGTQIWIPGPHERNESDAKSIKLEATLYTPTGTGKHPLLVFNHGLVSGLSRVKYDELAEALVSRGIAVVMPMRRGLAGSEGSRNQPYTCDTTTNYAGIDHAIEDIDAVLAYVRSNASYDMKRVLIGGNSRGGILSLVYAARKKPEGLLGVINFVGTWSSERSCPFDDVNTPLLKEAGAGSSVPTIWLYGEGDTYNSDKSLRSYAEIFKQAGGKVSFHLYSHDIGNGHKLLENGKRFWRPDLDAFLESLGFLKLQ